MYQLHARCAIVVVKLEVRKYCLTYIIRFILFRNKVVKPESRLTEHKVSDIPVHNYKHLFVFISPKSALYLFNTYSYILTAPTCVGAHAPCSGGYFSRLHLKTNRRSCHSYNL
jgi:hypothetical protein